MLTRDELEHLIRHGEIDTVLMVFPDLQGRLVGKRTTGRFFLQSVADAGTENCDYLIACDMDNNPVPGYRFTSYEQGYGEFYLFKDTYDEAHEKGYRNLQPHSPWLEDYHILQTTKDEYILGAIRRNLEAAGVPVEFSKGEAGKGQHEINLDYTTAVEMADRNSVYKLAAKEIAHFNGRSVSFMAKYDFNDTGSSCHIHSSLWTLDGQTAVFDDHHGPHGMSETFQHYLAGQIATAREFSLLWAPTINSYKRFQLGSWAPTGVGWGIDNRTLGFRKVGHGKGTRVECRIPGSDANSYFAFAGTLAGGLYGIKHKLPLGEAFMGNGYDAPDIPRIPWNIVDAINLWEGSTIAREAFGEEVHHHILTMAKAEWEAFNHTVTDWELRRYWERI